MQRGLSTIHTPDGSTVTVRRCGSGFDLETKNARGETISTVVMTGDELIALVDEAEGMIW